MKLGFLGEVFVVKYDICVLNGGGVWKTAQTMDII